MVQSLNQALAYRIIGCSGAHFQHRVTSLNYSVLRCTILFSRGILILGVSVVRSQFHLA